MDLTLLNAVVIPLALVIWGLFVKYYPPLAKIPNALISYLNVALAIIAQFVIPEPAHAGVGGAVASSLGWLWPPVQQVIAAQIYERWVRPVFEHFNIGKALPEGGRAPVPR